jgi:hypothetical protein
MTVTPKKIHVPREGLPESRVVIAFGPPGTTIEDRHFEPRVGGERPKERYVILDRMGRKDGQAKRSLHAVTHAFVATIM